MNWPEIRKALIKMGLSKLIGSTPNCLVPRETRNEQNRGQQNRQGKNNSQGNKTSPGQKKRNPQQKAQKGLTRFSGDQFKKKG